MKAVLDACVLVPDLMRILLIEAAARGHFEPRWSPRIFGEWLHAAARAVREAAAHEAAAGMAARWPGAAVAPAPAVPDLPDLPDPDDVHVLGTCLAAGAGYVVTRNHRDFPARALARVGVTRIDPDPLLLAFAAEDPGFADRAYRVAGDGGWPVRAVLRRAGLPRLGKALVKAPG